MFFTDKVTYRRIHIESSLVANSVCCSGRIRIKNGVIKSLKNKLSNMHKKHRLIRRAHEWWISIHCMH